MQMWLNRLKRKVISATDTPPGNKVAKTVINVSKPKQSFVLKHFSGPLLSQSDDKQNDNQIEILEWPL